MRVLITGGSGALARYCLEELRKHHHEVTLFDRIRPEDSSVPWSADAPVVRGDLTTAQDCLDAVEKSRAEAIIHLGAIPFASEEPERRKRTLEAGGTPLPEDETYRVNVMGTYYVADAARRCGVSTIAFASSMCVIEGPGRRPESIPERVTTVPVDEDAPLWGEQSYHLSKIVGEECLRGFARGYGVRVVCMRMMWVYFPHGGAAQREMMHLGMPAVPRRPAHSPSGSISMPATPPWPTGWRSNRRSSGCSSRSTSRRTGCAPRSTARSFPGITRIWRPPPGAWAPTISSCP